MEENGLETKNKLPKGFLLGAAMSAHQVEGNNTNSDWWYWEKQGKLPQSGIACDHYNRYVEDFQIAKSIGFNSLRISIEWARIEPQDNEWNQEAIEHYRMVLKKMKELGMIRMVTLFHFTLPLWLAQKGGFETKAGMEAFTRYAWFIASNLGDEIDIWCTINEPEVYASEGYWKGKWPPFKKSPLTFLKVYKNLAKAHDNAAEAIREVLPDAYIGLAKNNIYYKPHQGKLQNQFICWLANYFGSDWFLNRAYKTCDYIGLNFYFFRELKLGWTGIHVLNNESRPKSDMGWQTFPEGIYHALMNLKKYHLPVYITENGIANAYDDMRKDYIRQHLAWALKARKDGVDLRGYYYWSLTDNYEWQDGFDRLFGLVEINYATQERKIRPSAEVIKEMLNA
jgi:beta-glucosidase